MRTKSKRADIGRYVAATIIVAIIAFLLYIALVAKLLWKAGLVVKKRIARRISFHQPSERRKAAP